MVLQNLEKKTAHFLEGLASANSPPIYQLSIPAARQVLEDVQKVPVKRFSVRAEDVMLPCGPDGKVSVRIIRPLHIAERFPIIVYFHGGGWILGSKTTHERLVSELATGVKAAVAFVNYSPSPETKYPKPIEEAYAVLKYIAEHGDGMNLDSQSIAVAGDSVGGNMAAVVALLAKERKGPKILAQALFYPVTNANFHTASYEQFAEGPWLTKAAMEWFWNAYEPNVEDRKKHTVCPLHATVEQLQNLPPALVITDENDVLRDEGEAYAHKLMQAGVDVTSIRYLGTIHDFMLLNPLSDTPAARSATSLAISYLQKAFASRKTDRLKKSI